MVRKVNAMVLCFNRLWKLLIDRGMTRTEMRLAAGISTSTLAKLNKGEEVNTAILVKICNALNCGLEDIVEYHPAGMDAQRKVKRGKQMHNQKG